MRHSRSQAKREDRANADPPVNDRWIATTSRTRKIKPTRLSAEQAQRLVEDYQAGVRILDLAEQYSIGRSTVLAHLRRAGVPKYTGWTEQTTAEARLLYEAGLSLSEISERMGRARTTIGNHLRNAGVVMRPRGFS